jgi:hypothetical protein
MKLIRCSGSREEEQIEVKNLVSQPIYVSNRCNSQYARVWGGEERVLLRVDKR